MWLEAELFKVVLSELFMPNILLLETATDICSVAIRSEAGISAFAEEQQSNRHAEILTLLVDSCLRDANLEPAQLHAIAISRGPGSYTALRVGAAVAKGLCFALEKPLIAVDTLLSLAVASAESIPAIPGVDDLFVPMLDARRQEVWAGVYTRSGECILEAEPFIVRNNLFIDFLLNFGNRFPQVRFIFSGNGMKKMESGLLADKFVFSTITFSSAAHLSPIAWSLFLKSDFQSLVNFQPVYMKAPNITTPRSLTGI